MRTTRVLRWTVPIGVAGVVAAVTLLPSATTATANPALPSRTPGQLLADAAGSTVTGLSGTVVQTARLGLPELPAQSGATSGPLSLISGSHTIKVWLDGPQRQRLALVSQLAEYNVVHNGRDVWTYASETNKATHAVLPMRGAHANRAPGSTEAPGDPRGYATPGTAATAVLRAVSPTTVVSVDRTARVAGRPAYQLVLTPRDSRSLVKSVRVAIDSATKTPLRVQVWGARDGAKPALEVGFTDVRFQRPASSVFTFTPPPGAAVTQLPLGAGPSERKRPAGADRPRVIGSGWTSVLVLPAGSDTSRAGASGGRGSQVDLMNKLTTRVPGGRVLSSSLVSVLFTDNGRVLLGAVPTSELQRVARTAPSR